MIQEASWPEWWNWELDVSGHVRLRMTERSFNETDLRMMLADATALAPDVEPGRWMVETRWDGWPWKIIVEPEFTLRLLVVITAYPVE